MGTNITIENIHGYGLLDLQEILKQCDYTVSEVSKRFNIEDNLILVGSLLNSKEYSPLFDRSVDLYTKGLLSFTNKYIDNNLEYLNSIKRMPRTKEIISAERANNCMKIIVIAIWYKGIQQCESMNVIDAYKVIKLADNFDFTLNTPYPIVSDLILEQILKDGIKLDSIKCSIPYNAYKCLYDYYNKLSINDTDNVINTDSENVSRVGDAAVKSNFIFNDKIGELYLDSILSRLKSGDNLPEQLYSKVLELNNVVNRF